MKEILEFMEAEDDHQNKLEPSSAKRSFFCAMVAVPLVVEPYGGCGLHET